MGLSTAGAFCSDESAPRSQVASDTGCAVAAPCFRGVRPGPWPGPGRSCGAALGGWPASPALCCGTGSQSRAP